MNSSETKKCICNAEKVCGKHEILPQFVMNWESDFCFYLRITFGFADPYNCNNDSNSRRCNNTVSGGHGCYEDTGGAIGTADNRCACATVIANAIYDYLQPNDFN